MRKILITIVTLLLCSTMNIGNNVKAETQERVYVVMSPYAQVYHNTLNCSGLRNVTHQIKSVSIEKATIEMGRRPCKICCGH